MNVHKNAVATPKGREAMARAVVDDGLSKAEVARQFRTTSKTVSKWAKRFREEGVAGLRDRSSRPHSSPSQISLSKRREVEALRRQRANQEHIARECGISCASVSRILKACGLSLLSCLEPKTARPRYERETPGELIHIDIKKLGRFEHPGHRVTGTRQGGGKSRGAGWEYVHVAIDDHSRVAYSGIFPDETKHSAVAFLWAVVGYYQSLGIRIRRVMTDNGGCYKSKAFANACELLGIKHIRTRPYTPQTNGKAERFIQTAIREWAYGQTYQTSAERKADLPRWCHVYNWHRPHASLGKQPPISRIGLTGNNLLRVHI